MLSTSYYPNLSSFINIDSLPGDLQFIEELTDDLFKNIFVKEYQFNVSTSGETGNYFLQLKLYNRLGIDIPGTGMSLLINPGGITDSNPNTTEIPISLYYRLEILKYIKKFNANEFDYSPKAFSKLILNVFSLDQISVIDKAISEFVESNSVDNFVDLLNDFYSLSGDFIINYPISSNRKDSIIEIITSNSFLDLNISVTEVIFDLFIQNTDSSELIILKIQKFYSEFISGDIVQRIKNLLIPHLSVTIENVNLALEFPRSVFRPIATSSLNASPAVPVGKALPEEFKTLLKFNVGSLSFSTENGFHFQNENSFDFQKSFIANTQFSLEIQGMKLDLSRTSNIPEANADGRPVDFVGVYIKDGSIGFPADWGHNEAGSTAELFVNNLLVGTGGISGTIGMRAKNGVNSAPVISCKLGGKVELSLTDFSLTFQQNEIISSTIKGANSSYIDHLIPV